MRRSSSGSTDLHGFGEEIRRELAERIPNDAVRVLDVGTGFAGSVQFLARAMPKGSRIWTLDPSSDVLASARKALKAEGLGGNVELVQASIEKVDFDDEFFDILVSVMALHHMSSLKVVLAQMTRVVKPGGKLLLADFAPKAARELKFRSRHVESEFFDGEAVQNALRSKVSSSRVWSFSLWYLVEATK